MYLLNTTLVEEANQMTGLVIKLEGTESGRGTTDFRYDNILKDEKYLKGKNNIKCMLTENYFVGVHIRSRNKG